MEKQNTNKQYNPKLSFWVNKKITMPTKVSFVKKECKHRWRVGSFIGYFIGKQVRKKGVNIWCENCNKKLKAYYKSR